MTEIPDHLLIRENYNRQKAINLMSVMDENPEPDYFDYVEGDLIEMARNGKFDIIFHGANCMQTMGSGIAKTIRENWGGAAAKADAMYGTRGDASKMGEFSYAIVDNKHGQKLIVANLYTQYGYGTDFQRLSTQALERSLTSLIATFDDPTLRFGFPQIGAGLGGGDWGEIAKIIDRCFRERDYNCRHHPDTGSCYDRPEFQRPTCVIFP